LNKCREEEEKKRKYEVQVGSKKVEREQETRSAEFRVLGKY
jgi:hypothetical protein